MTPFTSPIRNPARRSPASSATRAGRTASGSAAQRRLAEGLHRWHRSRRPWRGRNGQRVCRADTSPAPQPPATSEVGEEVGYAQPSPVGVAFFVSSQVAGGGRDTLLGDGVALGPLGLDELDMEDDLSRRFRLRWFRGLGQGGDQRQQQKHATTPRLKSRSLSPTFPTGSSTGRAFCLVR